MKRIIVITLSLLLASASGMASGHPSAVYPASGQSVEDINAAALAQISKELGLSDKQLKKFEPIYKEYRAAMAKAVDADANGTATDEASQRKQIKAKLGNIAAVAETKREYVDRFATVLTAEQIRTLYNAEGAIGTDIKRSSTSKYRKITNKRIEGSSRMVSRDFGAAGDYSALAVSSVVKVIVSAVAHTVTVEANDNIIDLVKVERSNGTLKIGLENTAASMNNIRVTATVPASANLSSITASGYSYVESALTLKGKNMAVNVSGGAEVKADLSGQSAQVSVSGYGKFEGETAVIGKCTYSVSGGASANGGIKAEKTELSISGYGKLNGNIASGSVVLNIFGGGKLIGDIKADTFDAALSGYGSETGAISAEQCDITVSGGASINGTLDAGTFKANVSGYSKIRFTGGKAASGTVSVGGGSSFSAPAVTVRDYSISASGYAKADVKCTGTLKVNAVSGGKVNYSGDCRVEATNPNVKKVE